MSVQTQIAVLRRAQKQESAVLVRPPLARRELPQCSVGSAELPGDTVTVVRGLVLTSEDLKNLAKDLKETCGTGGTVKDGTIEIQGDHRSRVAARLKALGYKTNA